MAREPVGTFTRDGVSREAYTAGEAVALRAEGWSEAAPRVERPHAQRHHEPKAEAAEVAGTPAEVPE